MLELASIAEFLGQHIQYARHGFGKVVIYRGGSALVLKMLAVQLGRLHFKRGRHLTQDKGHFKFCGDMLAEPLHLHQQTGNIPSRKSRAALSSASRLWLLEATSAARSLPFRLDERLRDVW